MDKKLTLTIDEELIDFVREYSKGTHQSISKIVEKHLQDLRDIKPTVELPAKTKRLYGILEKDDIPDKKKLRKIFHEKSLD